MNELQRFKNGLFEVAVKLENDEVVFEAGVTAKSLGFIRNQVINGKQYTSVRWERVNKYLSDVGFTQQVGEGDLIPESIVYLLAFKGETKLAIDFQKWLAIEVIPSIRKTGQYVKPLSEREQLVAAMKLSIETAEEITAVKEEVKEVRSMVENQITLESGEQRRVQIAIASRVYELESNKELRPSFFAELHREIRNRFAVSTYKDIRKKDLQSALTYIEAWIPRRVS